MMNVVKAFLAGLTVGILFAPQSGVKTRKRIGKVFKDYKDDAKDYVAGAAGKAESKIRGAKKAIQQL
ncbi:MAG: YtxH domain-containing protein [Chitinophagaceae bacterium]|nr:YtxH domain-containing protein [Chitinophagaceae bacterium]